MPRTTPDDAGETLLRREVLHLVLKEHPTELTAAEITLALADDGSFPARDAVGRAVRDLIDAGVLRQNADSIVPTRAITYLDQLLEDGLP